MGSKSTVRLTRAEAEHLYVSKMLSDRALKRRLRGEAVAMSDRELEDALEKLNDARYERGEGLDNYLISTEDEVGDWH